MNWTIETYQPVPRAYGGGHWWRMVTHWTVTGSGESWVGWDFDWDFDTSSTAE